jgi:hypothetical protein
MKPTRVQGMELRLDKTGEKGRPFGGTTATASWRIFWQNSCSLDRYITVDTIFSSLKFAFTVHEKVISKNMEWGAGAN